MTVAEASSVSPLYVGNNVTTEFDFDFRVLSDDEITVYQLDTTDDTESVLIKDVDYSVALTNEGVDGGSITMLAGAPADTIKLRIVRNTDKDQLVNISNQGAFYPSVLNGAFDKAVMLIQELNDAMDRAVLVEPTSSQTPDELVQEMRDAVDTANAADAKADAAVATANTASSNATTALSNSSTAVSTANSAVSTANAAVSTANSAVSTANAADAKGDSAIALAHTFLASAKAYADLAVASAIAGLIPYGTPLTWSTTITGTTTQLSTPFRFDKGILVVGGVTYDLADPAQVTLTNVGNTIITFAAPITGDHDVVMVAFASGSAAGTIGTTWGTTLTAGEDEITTPYLFTKGILYVGGVVFNLSDATHATLSTVGGVTVITLAETFTSDQECILVILG